MIVFSHIRNTGNVGDLASCPAHYFEFPKHHIVNYDETFPVTVDAVIYGGGTMVNWFQRRELPNVKKIGWGIGSSRHGIVDPWPEPIGFALLGIREYTENDERNGTYVPCASCMSPLFDREYEIEHEAVIFENSDIVSRYPVSIGGLPTMGNTEPLEDIIAFLGSAETVITNSYHGVYWSTLLGRKVVCLPYSSKFHWFKYPPAYSSDGGLDWRKLKPATWPAALDDARAINRGFYERAMEIL